MVGETSWFGRAGFSGLEVCVSGEGGGHLSLRGCAFNYMAGPSCCCHHGPVMPSVLTQLATGQTSLSVLPGGRAQPGVPAALVTRLLLAPAVGSATKKCW